MSTPLTFPPSNIFDCFSVSWWLQYALESYREDPGHVLIETFCIGLIVYLLTRKPSRPTSGEDRLSREEEDSLINEWTPEALVPAAAADMEPREELIVEGTLGAYVQVNGVRCLNLASSNFLDITSNPEIKEACRAVIEKYGVGSCGPRGFYGTIDLHLDLEKEVARFMSANDSIAYSDGIACVSSSIPAFAKKGDLLICDEGVSYGIQQGILLSRANVLYFKHNDVEDMERLLRDVEEQDVKHPPNNLNRRFIVVEGVYQYHGDIAPLARIVDLKRKYRYRLIVEDSYGIGVLGPTGRGSLEHAGLDSRAADIYCANFDTALGSVGGFCIGKQPEVVDHQRLSGAGYCFSASAPPYTCEAAIQALRFIDSKPKISQHVRDNARFMRQQLTAIPSALATMPGGPDCVSPTIHLRLSKAESLGLAADNKFFRRIARSLREQHNICVEVPVYIPSERKQPEPSLRIMVSASHTQDELKNAAALIKTVFMREITVHRAVTVPLQGSARLEQKE